MRAGLLAAAALAASAGGAAAEVVDVQPSGFQVRTVLEIAARPDRVWAALVQPGRWWNSSHTWSGDARNLSLGPRARGCFCETWAGGGVQHMTVTFVKPNAQLNLWGALGPLGLEGADGALVVRLAPAGSGTRLEMTYSPGGYLKDGAATWAPLVDGVLAEQFGRLERLVETGRAGSAAR